MRISTTTLESFRLFLQPDNEWMAEEELAATIRGEFRGNHKVWLGMAFGAVIEEPEKYLVSGGYRVENLRGCGETFEFGDDVMGPMLAVVDRQRTVFEAKAVGPYAGHDVVAKADQMVGSRIVETKATLSTFDFDKYAASCQWRFMLDIFGAASVTYRVACLSEGEANGVISLRGVESFTLYPYADLRADLEDLVREFDGYVTARGLVDVLNQRQREAA